MTVTASSTQAQTQAPLTLAATATTSAPSVERAHACGDAPALPQGPSRHIEVVHVTRYDYTAPVSASHHAGCLQPLQDAGQALDGFRLDIDPEPTSLCHRHDAQGHACVHFQIDRPHGVLQVRATSRVRVRARFAHLRQDGSPAWETVAERLRYVAARPCEPAVAFAQPSPYVPRLDALRAYAAASFSAGRPVAHAAARSRPGRGVLSSAALLANDQLGAGPDFIDGAYLYVDKPQRQRQIADHVLGDARGHAGGLLWPGNPYRTIASDDVA